MSALLQECAYSRKRAGRIRSVQVTMLLLVSIVISAGMGCDRASRVREGMTEAETRRLLGEPAQIIHDARRFEAELANDQSCARNSMRVLLFNLGNARHLRVGIDSEGRVRCTHKTTDLMR